jgi:hypothetical protein
MAGGERGTLREVVDVKMGSLGDGAPLAVEQDEGSEAVGIGGRKNPRPRAVVVSIGFEASVSQSMCVGGTHCSMISSGSFLKRNVGDGTGEGEGDADADVDVDDEGGKATSTPALSGEGDSPDMRSRASQRARSG